MKINSFTNYSFRILIMLGANPGRTIPLSEIAEAYQISINHLKKVAARLIEQDLVSTVRGRNGGLMLKKSPDRIRLGEIFRIAQTDTAFVECMDPESEGCVISPVCRLQGIFRSALLQFIETMDAYTLMDLVKNKDEINDHLNLIPLAEAD